MTSFHGYQKRRVATLCLQDLPESIDTLRLPKDLEELHSNIPIPREHPAVKVKLHSACDTKHSPKSYRDKPQKPRTFFGNVAECENFLSAESLIMSCFAYAREWKAEWASGRMWCHTHWAFPCVSSSRITSVRSAFGAPSSSAKHPDGLYWYHTLLTVCIKYKTMYPKRPKNLYAALTQQNVA